MELNLLLSNWFAAAISLSFLHEATLEHDFDAFEKTS
jgi:hypothetical protein